MNTIDKPKEILNCGNFVKGQWLQGSGEVFKIYSPYFGEVVGESRSSTKDNVDEALRIAAGAA